MATLHHKIETLQDHTTAYEWQEDCRPPFNELMITWNALRPSQGRYAVYASLNTGKWSPWLPYVLWGSDGQKSFQMAAQEDSTHVFQDTVEVLNGKMAIAFKIRIEAHDGACLKNVHALHACATDLNGLTPGPYVKPFPSVCLDVQGHSQIALRHARNMSMCSPTSTAAVVKFLKHGPAVDPIGFAQNVYDSGFDIYGNWVMNVAEAYTYLGKEWGCWASRLSGFEDIYDSLGMGIPVVVSVRGPLKGSAMPYKSGHLIAVKGFDAKSQEVLCMDPAFPSDDATHVRYALKDFLEAWGRRNFVAYIFKRSQNLWRINENR